MIIFNIWFLKLNPIIRFKSGFPNPLPSSLPFTASSASVANNLKLEKGLNSLQNEHEDVIEDCQTAFHKIRTLEAHSSLKNEDDKSFHQELLENNYLVSQLSFAVKELEKKDKSTQSKLDDQTIEIQKIQMTIKNCNEISSKLQKELSET